ncbi:uncharacterized protein LOC115222983 [Argonauta hians]
MGDEENKSKHQLMTTLESLGNHLHSQILTRFPELSQSLVSKITGVLLECGEKEVLAMLQNRSKLQQRISKVFRTLHTDDETADCRQISQQPPDNVSGGKVWTDEDSEELFDKVAALEPEHCAKITGMLLERDATFLQQSLTNEDLLKSAVSKARLTYLLSISSSSSPSSNTITTTTTSTTTSRTVSLSPSSYPPPITCDVDPDATPALQDADTMEDKGDLIYEQVVNWFTPKLAEKITGMLLEMPSEELTHSINNLKTLKNKATEAYMALKDSGYLTMYQHSWEHSQQQQ